MNENDYKIPLGIGAVVKDSIGFLYVRVGHNQWEAGGSRFVDAQLRPAAEAGNLTTLSEGGVFVTDSTEQEWSDPEPWRGLKTGKRRTDTTAAKSDEAHVWSPRPKWLCEQEARS